MFGVTVTCWVLCSNPAGSLLQRKTKPEAMGVVLRLFLSSDKALDLARFTFGISGYKKKLNFSNKGE